MSYRERYWIERDAMRDGRLVTGLLMLAERKIFQQTAGGRRIERERNTRTWRKGKRDTEGK